MRIHSDIITATEIDAAITAAGPAVRATRLTAHGSRSRARAFDVILTGSNTRRQNRGTDMAATYDEWGHFLSHLFDVDPNMTCPYYNGRDDFHTKTANVYRVGAIL